MKKKSDKEILKEENTPQGSAQDDQIKFDLADDKKEYVNLDMKDENLSHIGNLLQKLHLKNHSLSSKETIHEVYRPDEEFAENESYALSPEDEALFDEIQHAVAEHDILSLRSNLQFISKNTSAHNYSSEEIEDFVEGDYDELSGSRIQEELLVNNNLRDDVKLYKEINQAVVEKDIMQLRLNLAGICKNESSHSRSIEEIENYLADEFEDEALKEAFEEEMLINAGLRNDVKICSEINEAIGERDIIDLRKDLDRIRELEVKDDSEKRGISTPRIQRAVWVAAASIILLMGLNVVFWERSLSNSQLYDKFYQPYDLSLGINRSVSLARDNLLNRAMFKMNEKDYDTALLLFSEALKKDKDDVISNFYIGTLQQKKGNYDEAIRSFNCVIKQGDNLFIEQSEWYIGLCYLNRNEREKAIGQFKKIVQKRGYYQKQSEKILKKLE